jgi:putative nucleotidyltransferase with HDIG domain
VPAGTPVADAQAHSLTPEMLRQRVQHLRTVPTLPALLAHVVTALDDPDVDFENVAELIEVDQSLTALILRLANSAFYNAQGRVSRVTDALLMLGTSVTRSVVLAASVFDVRGRSLPGFWEHSLGCAVAAGAIAKATKLANTETMTAAGLLHDIGKVVVYKEMPEVFERIVERARLEERSFRELEHELLGVDHAEIAGWVIDKWRLPATLAEPIVWHHRPSRARAARTETAIVHVANSLVRALDFGWGGDHRIPAIDPLAWSHLGLNASVLDEILDTFDLDLDHAMNYAQFE